MLALLSLPDSKQLRAKALLSLSAFLSSTIFSTVSGILYLLDSGCNLGCDEEFNHLIFDYQLFNNLPMSRMNSSTLLACIVQSFLDTFNNFPMIS